MDPSEVVGATGFEPATPCAQGRCATRLRYAPTPRSYVDHSRNCVGGAETAHRRRRAILRNPRNPGHFVRLGAPACHPHQFAAMLEVSLLDDARFLEELAKIEALPPEDTSVFPKPVPTVGGNQPPTAITDELPPALGPRTKGPQFVLAPPPSKRKSTYRSSSRSAARSRKAVVDEAPADAIENIAVTASDSSRATSDEQGITPALEPAPLPEKNPGTEASLSAFPSARAAASTNTERNRVREPKRSAPLHPMLAVVGFLLMMSVGAGAAALVFHDRVTQIVQLLERSAARR